MDIPHFYTQKKHAFYAKIRLYATACLLLLPASSIWAKHKNERPELVVNNIPVNLKNEFADAVLRYDSTYLKIVSIDEVEYYHTYAVTVMNEKGKAYGNLMLSYSRLKDINDISGTYYDASGKILQQIKHKDIVDRSTFGSDYVFNSDNRIKAYQYVSVNYPYTAVITVKETIKNTLFLPGWQPQDDHNLSLVHSVFYLDSPDSTAIRTKTYNMPLGFKTVQKKENGRTIRSWSLNNQPAFEEQPYSETGNFNTPALAIVAQDFDLMGHSGKLDNWKDFGLFNYNLNNGRDNLSPEMVQKVKALVQDNQTIAQKVQTLYHYMQQNTRYVADEAGISGWQTFPASEVCSKGYGDCKGLTNYLKALLKAAGIPAYMTLASAGSDDYYKVDPSFPDNYFNHVILCVPAAEDTIWVECTSSVFQAGYLGDFTDDRYVLVCGSKGGKLVKTPSYGIGKNFIRRTAVFQLNPDAENQQIRLDNYYSGPMQDNLYMLLKMTSNDKIQKTLHSKFNFPSYKINQFHYDFTGTHLLPAIEEHIEASASGIVNHTGKRCFVQISWLPNPMNEIIQTTARTRPLVLDKSFTVSDSVVVALPSGYAIEYVPEAVGLNYPFASLHCAYAHVGDKVVYIRQYTQHKGVYDKKYFKDYQSLYHKVNQQNHGDNIVLIPKPSSDAITKRQ